MQMNDTPIENALDLLTVHEVCVQLGTSRYQIYRLIHSGALPAVKLRTARNKFRVRKSDLEDFKRGDFVTVAEPVVDNAYRTVADVAARLNCSHETVRRLVGTGELVAIRFPGKSSRLRISDAAVDAYLQAHRAKPAAAEQTA
jgi:excisionase family DNA binding protein